MDRAGAGRKTFRRLPLRPTPTQVRLLATCWLRALDADLHGCTQRSRCSGRVSVSRRSATTLQWTADGAASRPRPAPIAKRFNHSASSEPYGCPPPEISAVNCISCEQVRADDRVYFVRRSRLCPQRRQHLRARNGYGARGRATTTITFTFSGGRLRHWDCRWRVRLSATDAAAASAASRSLGLRRLCLLRRESARERSLAWRRLVVSASASGPGPGGLDVVGTAWRCGFDVPVACHVHRGAPVLYSAAVPCYNMSRTDLLVRGCRGWGGGYGATARYSSSSRVAAPRHLWFAVFPMVLLFYV